VSSRIYLVRHGESEWNAAHRYTGQQDVALTPLGRQQAMCVAERLAKEPIAAIYSSPLQRAHHNRGRARRP
jgi:broad specificity phosphatase PhoE